MASGKGEASLILASVAIILVFSNIVGGATLVYLVPRKNFSQLMILSYLWALLISTLSYFVLNSFSLSFDIDPAYAQHIALLSFLNAFLSINLTALIGKEKIGANNVISILQQCSSLLFIIAIIVSTQSLTIKHYIQSLYIAYSIASLLSFIGIFKYFEPFKGSFIALLKDCFKIGLINQSAHLITMINFRISYYFLNSLVDSAAVGIYSNAISLIESSWIITRSVALVQYSKIANTEDKKTNQQLSNRLSKLSIVLSIAILVPMSILPPSFYEFVFGREFGDINNIIMIMMPSMILYNYYLILGHYFSGIGNYLVSVIASGAGLVFTILLSYPLIQNYQLQGASIATTISTFVAAMVVLIWFMKEAKLSVTDLIITKADLKL